MKGLLFVLVIFVAGVVSLGFYRGWFSVTSDSSDGKGHVTGTLDQDKFQKDKDKTLAKVQDAVSKDKTAATEKRMDGTVVSISGDKLMMATKEGKDHGHTLATDVKVTCDAKVCKAADLKPGMRIRVTMKNGDADVATRIEALDKNAEFEKGS